MDQITVVVLGDPAEPELQKLEALRPGVNFTISKTADGLGDAVRDARVLFTTMGNRKEVGLVLERGAKLEWIQSRSAGLDGFLSPELIESPIPLTNGSGVFSQSLGEFVLFGALYFAKDIPRMLRAKAAHKWDVFDVCELSTQTMGIVGHGDIGRAAAKRAKAMGMKVLALRRTVTPRPGDEDVDRVYATAELHDMLPECDYVVAAAPLTPATKHMLSTAEFGRMKPSAVVMNVGRGPVIDEAALAEALRSGVIRGAVLDVFEVEPLGGDSPLWDMDNVLISAHTADHTQTWLEDSVDFFMAQFARWRSGEALQNLVDKRAGY
jgi:phosphoglycerate dehydrogenase-like enzyme